MRTARKLIALAAALLLLGGLCAAAFAHDVPDLTREDCTISLVMRYQGKAVPGGSVTLYRVADVYEYDGNYTFRLTDEFAATSLNLENLRLDEPGYTAEMAQTLANFAAVHPKIAGRTETIDRYGEVVFDKLTPGLYLLTNYSAYTGGYYYTANPFLVSVPLMEDGKYDYTVDATPKTDLDRNHFPGKPTEPSEPVTPPDKPGKPQTPVTPSVPTAPTPPTSPSRPVLPQTGQVNWPVPVLAVLGLCVFSAGWVLRFGKRGRDEK